MAETPPTKDEKQLSPAEKAKLAAAKKAEAAKKAGPVGDPLVDNGDGSITDPNSGLTWKKTDAWLDKKQFYTWQNHQEYVDWVNQNKDQFGGYDNWRIPTKAESLTLFDKTGVKQLLDKNGTYYPIDPIFAPGGASNTWITECSDEKIIRMDLKIGLDTPYPTNDVWSSMRLVRKEGEASAKPTSAAPAEAKAAEVPVEDAPAPEVKATPVKKSSGNFVPGPKPRKDFSSEEKAAMLKRARAHAAEVKAKKGK